MVEQGMMLEQAGAGDGNGSSLLASLRLELRAERVAAFRQAPVGLLHAALHRAIDQELGASGEPARSRRIHDDNDKRLTLSPLYRVTDDRPLYGDVATGERIWARLTTLDRPTLLTLMAAIGAYQQVERPLDLDWQPFSIAALAPYPVGDCPAVTTTTELAATAEPGEVVTLRFLSPTVFRRGNERILRPDPLLVFGSHLRRWQAITSSGDRERLEDWVDTQITLVDGQWPVEHMDLSIGQQRGFTGWARYEVTGNRTFRHSIATLARFSTYSGTGARTALGMGQTVVDTSERATLEEPSSG